jgi:hypothetical protein
MVNSAEGRFAKAGLQFVEQDVNEPQVRESRPADRGRVPFWPRSDGHFVSVRGDR